MTETTTKDLLRQSVKLIAQTDAMIAQADANTDLPEIDRVYAKERLMLYKLTQQSQYASLKADALFQKQYELSQQQQDLLQEQYDQLITLADLNGRIHNQATVIDNILVLTELTEGKSH